MEQLDDYRKMTAELARVATIVIKRKQPFMRFRRIYLEQLLSDIDCAGGHVTKSETGTCMEVLEVLAPYLPSEFKISFSSAKRIWGVKKSKAASI